MKYLILVVNWLLIPFDKFKTFIEPSSVSVLKSINGHDLLIIDKKGNLISTIYQKKRQFELAMFDFDQKYHRDDLIKLLIGGMDDYITIDDLNKFKIKAKQILEKGFFNKFNIDLTKNLKIELDEEDRRLITAALIVSERRLK